MLLRDEAVWFVPEAEEDPLFVAASGSPPIIPDIDGDGRDDVMMANAEYDYWGEEYDWYSKTGGLWLYRHVDQRSGEQGIGTEDALLVGTCDSVIDGWWTNPVGDVTGDGKPDVAVGSYELDLPGRPDSGAIFILSKLDEVCGTTEIVHATDAILVGAESGDRLRSSGRIGDWNGDGIDDLVVAAPHAGCCGKVYLFFGPVCGTIDASDANLVVEGTGEDVFFGAEVEWLGDFDGDGVDDLLVSAPSSHWGNTYGGAVYVLSGARMMAEARP